VPIERGIKKSYLKNGLKSAKREKVLNDLEGKILSRVLLLDEIGLIFGAFNAQ